MTLILVSILFATAGTDLSTEARSSAFLVPRLLNYQGRLTDSSGLPVPDSVYALTFRLYAQPVGGVPFWFENQSIAVCNGVFSVELGRDNPIGGVPDSGEVYLGVALAGEELEPRSRIVSTLYAVRADTANYALAAGSAGADNAWVRGTPDSVLFTVKQLGIARGGASNVIWGGGRHTHTNLGNACTTGMAGFDCYYCAVGGGFGNSAAGNYSTLAGGLNNSASSEYATVGGGGYNHAGGTYATVAGGQGNAATSGTAAVGGGKFNLASGMNSTIAGGKYNTAAGYCSVVAGGVDNSAVDQYAGVLGGSGNTAGGAYSSVAGGFGNVASGHCALVAGGFCNVARGQASVAAGTLARANHSGSFVWSDSARGDGESTYTTGADQFRVRSRGGVWFFSNSEMTRGVYLAPGASAWSAIGASAGDILADRVEELLAAVQALREENRQQQLMIERLQQELNRR
ncbi:MAG: hypothetical protein ABIK43_00610 [candidate division WOR-3 bacterium]